MQQGPAPPTTGRRDRRIRRLPWAIAALAVAAATAGAAWHAIAERRDLAAHPPPGRLVEIGDGLRLHLHCSGEGSPTVLLEAGLGNDVNHWSLLQPGLASDIRVCAYDRAGLGWSAPGPQPRSAGRIVDELAHLLDAAGEAGPFVLVGHSNGGAYARLFAAARPDDVVGLVLVDPNTEMLEPCPVLPLATRILYGGLVGLAPVGVPRAILPVMFPLDRSALPEDAKVRHGALRARTSALRALWSETRETCPMLAAVREAAAPREGLPIVLLSAGRRPAGQPSPLELHRAMVARWPGAELEVIDDSGHWVQLERPEVVADAVRRVLVEASATP